MKKMAWSKPAIHLSHVTSSRASHMKSPLNTRLVAAAVHDEHAVQQEEDHRQGAKVDRLVQVVARFVHWKVTLRPRGRRHASRYGQTIEHECANRNPPRAIIPDDL